MSNRPDPEYPPVALWRDLWLRANAKGNPAVLRKNVKKLQYRVKCLEHQIERLDAALEKIKVERDYYKELRT